MSYADQDLFNRWRDQISENMLACSEFAYIRTPSLSLPPDLLLLVDQLRAVQRTPLWISNLP
jgi:hypothetical protein